MSGNGQDMRRENENWIAELRNNHESVVAELREFLLRNLRKSLSNMSRLDDALIEDAVQESVIRILSRLDDFQGRSQFETWATSIAIRFALNELRRRRWQDVSFSEVMTHGKLAYDQIRSRQPTAGEVLEKSAFLEVLKRMIDSELTEKQRSALIAELKGMPQDEIARHLGSSRNAIYKLTHDARKKLKRSLEAAGYTFKDISATIPT